MEQVLGRPITPADFHLLQSPAQLDDPQHWLDCRDFSRTNPIASVTRTDRLLQQAQTRAQRDHDARLARAHFVYQTRATHYSIALLSSPSSEVLDTKGSRIRFSSYITYHLVPLRLSIRIPSVPFELTNRELWPGNGSPNGLRTILIKSSLPPLPPRLIVDDRVRSPHNRSAEEQQAPPTLATSEVSRLFPFFDEPDLPPFLGERPLPDKRKTPLYAGFRDDAPGASRFIAHIDHPRSAPSAIVLVNMRPHLALIDTGAAVSILSETSWRLLGSPTLQVPDSELHSVEQRPLRVLGRVLFTIFIGGLTVEFPLWVMSDTITDGIIGVNFMRRIRATINLETNQLLIPGSSGPISLSPLPSPPETPPRSPSISPVKRIKVAARSCCMIQCSLQDTIPRHSTILIEPIASSPVQVARSLNQPQDEVTWVQIRNAGDSPLICSPGELIGTFTILPPDFEELGHPDENHATDTDTHATSTIEELPPADPLSPSLSQHVYPNYIAAVQSTLVLNELPINWKGSTLNPTQREMLRKILLQHDIFVTTSKAPGRTDLVKCYINTGSAHPIKQAPYR
ncbi:hypothetical protein AeRB84_007377, partial [Aphanomyces euteiches]